MHGPKKLDYVCEDENITVTVEIVMYEMRVLLVM